MDPRLNTKGCTLIVLAEHKKPIFGDENTLALKTSSIRRNSPLFLDSKIHHNNMLNNIIAKIEANISNVDDALMLDQDGYVSETNSTNVFMIKSGVLATPHEHACLPGITRGLILNIAKSIGMEVIRKNLSLTEFYNADQVFVTGTMSELTAVASIDGRLITNKSSYDFLEKLKFEYKKMTNNHGVVIP